MPMFKAKSDLNSEAQNSGSSSLALNTCFQEKYGSSCIFQNFKINFSFVFLNYKDVSNNHCETTPLHTLDTNKIQEFEHCKIQT
jgi:hypothetical protein